MAFYIYIASLILVDQVSNTYAARKSTWDSCGCEWDTWKAWSDCDSDCFGSRVRRRSVWTICEEFSDCATDGSGSESQECNDVCHNGGTWRGLSWQPCTCPSAYHGRCCTNRVDCSHPGYITNGAVYVPSTYYGRRATYTCNTNYRMIGGNRVRQCQANFAWSGRKPTCIFANHCRSAPCKNGAACVNLLDDFRCSCANGWGGYLCTNDIQPPVMTGCSNDVYINANDSTVHYDWTAPIFMDPMNTKLDIVCNFPRSEFTFPWGDHTVQYVATKLLNRKVTECSFKIKIRPTPCEDLNVPANGALLCNGWKTDYGRFCMITCRQNYTLAPSKSFYTWYVCGASGSWIAASPVPDCEVEVESEEEAEYYQPEYATFVFSSACEDGATRNALQSLYIKRLKRPDGFSPFCSSNKLECMNENVNVQCGSYESN